MKKITRTSTITIGGDVYGVGANHIITSLEGSVKKSSGLHIGSVVHIREDLVVGHVYGGETFIGEMNWCRGKVAAITGHGFYENRFFIDLDDETFHWTPEMFEKKT